MTPLHGIACFYDVGFGARAVSSKTPIYFIIIVNIIIIIIINIIGNIIVIIIINIIVIVIIIIIIIPIKIIIITIMIVIIIIMMKYQECDLEPESPDDPPEGPTGFLDHTCKTLDVH